MIFRRPVCIYSVVAAGVLVASLANAASYNEFVDGDLSNDGLSPTTLTLDAGSNLLTAQSSAADHDIMRIDVPTGHTLDSVIVEFHEDINRVFVGLQAGPIWTAGTGFDIDPTQMLGWVDFPTDLAQSHTGEDILDDMGLGAGAAGFVPPLPNGSYTFLFQAPSSAINFALSFRVSGPASALPGDFNADNDVDAADLAIWRGAFGVTNQADANGDGDSDGADMLLWQRSLGSALVAPATAAVPEGGASILAAEILILLRIARGARKRAKP